MPGLLSEPIWCRNNPKSAMKTVASLKTSLMYLRCMIEMWLHHEGDYIGARCDRIVACGEQKFKGNSTWTYCVWQIYIEKEANGSASTEGHTNLVPCRGSENNTVCNKALIDMYLTLRTTFVFHCSLDIWFVHSHSVFKMYWDWCCSTS